MIELFAPSSIGAVATECAERLYDPTGRASERQMAAFLAGKYAVGHVSDEDQPRHYILNRIVADGYEAGIVVWQSGGLVTPHGTFCEEAAIPDEVRDRIDLVEERTSLAVSSILAQVDIDAPTAIKSIQAAEEIAYRSSAGKKRKNGGGPYYQHPLEAAAIMKALIDELRHTGHKIDARDVVSIVATVLMHDSIEEWIKSSDYYTDMPAVAVLTPLVIKRVLTEAGMSGQRPMYVSNGVRLMSKEKGQPWLETYSDYITRLSSSYLSCTAKLADVLHNYVIQPNPIPAQKPDETIHNFEARLAKHRQKQQLYHGIIFGNGLVLASNPKNAFQHDSRLRRWGRPLVNLIAQNFGPTQAGNAETIELFRAKKLPTLVKDLQVSYHLPVRY